MHKIENSFHNVRGADENELNKNENETIKKYGDILEIQRPLSPKHMPMAIEKRAAQFMPFAALSGFEDAIENATRNYYDEKSLVWEHFEKPMDEA